MPRVALTAKQKAEQNERAYLDQLYSAITGSIKTGCDKGKAETATALGIHPNTWKNWRDGKFSRDFTLVALAAYRAGYQIKIEPREGNKK